MMTADTMVTMPKQAVAEKMKATPGVICFEE